MNEATITIITIIGATLMASITLTAVVFGMWLAFRKPTVYANATTPAAWNNLPW